MIVCTKHTRHTRSRLAVPPCLLQDHVAKAWVEAQSRGGTAQVILTDAQDPEHIAFALLDMEDDKRAKLLALYGLSPEGRRLDQETVSSKA